MKKALKPMAFTLALIMSFGVFSISAVANPNGSITRGEFAQMLWETNGKPEPGKGCPFTDVDADNAKAIASLYEKGVVTGYGGGIFGQDDVLTWEMVYVFAMRNWNLISDNPGAYVGYEDAASISSWAQNAASYMFEQGLGAAITYCSPQSPVTRSEAAALLTDIKNKEYFKPGGELDVFIERLASEDRFSGTVAVGKNDSIIFEGAYGYANRETGLKMQTKTKINLGSINKSFTAVAICQLIQEGKLSYSDTLETYLPEFAELSKGRITIEQILTHTAGLGNFRTNEEYLRNKDRIFTTEELLPYTMMESLLFEPGTDNSYSNSGFVILGAIIERVAQKDYFDYIDQRVFTPAGMESSTYKYDPNDEGFAKGYIIEGDRNFIDNKELLPPVGCSAGGGYSTASDMLRFMNALNNDILLNGSLTELFSSTGTGYGMYRTKVAGKDAIGMSGGAEGIASSYEIYPEVGYSVAILTNSDDGFNRVFSEIKRFLLGAAPAPTMRRGQVEVNGETVETTILTQDDEAFVPLIEILETLGANITDETIRLNNVTLTISSDGVTCTIEGETKAVPSRRMMSGGRAMVFAPIHFYIETFGCQIVVLGG